MLSVLHCVPDFPHDDGLIPFSHVLQPMHAVRTSARGTTDMLLRNISSEFPLRSSSKTFEDSPVQLKEDTCVAASGQQVPKKKGRRRRKNTVNDLELEALRLQEANQQLEHDIATMRLQMRTMRRQHQRQLQREADAFVDQLAKELEASRKAR